MEKTPHIEIFLLVNVKLDNDNSIYEHVYEDHVIQAIKRTPIILLGLYDHSETISNCFKNVSLRTVISLVRPI